MMQNIALRGSGFIHLWPSAVILCIFPLLAFVLLPHLKRAIESHKYEKIKISYNSYRSSSDVNIWLSVPVYAVLLVLIGWNLRVRIAL